MRLLDMSQPVFDGGPNCPGHPAIISEIVSDHERGAWHMERLTMASHTGSHLDAPLHKIPGGKAIDELPLERFTGSAYIADLRPMEPESFITAERLAAALPAALPPDSIVLMSTGWGDIRERTERWLYQSPKLAPDAARWLVEKQIRGLGIDHWGIGGWDSANDETVHTILLGNGIWIVEELRFPLEVYALPQPQNFMTLPINLRGHSGAWCRPVLLLIE